MSSRRHPWWLRQRGLEPSVLFSMKKLVEHLSLHTVCESAQCPNQARCFSQGTATFLILGDICTRNCSFCAIKKGQPFSPDTDEPRNVALAANQLELKHVVVTSVTRDDLPNGGAIHFAKTVDAIRQINPNTTVEVLVPDFQGSVEALQTITNSVPEVINHNVETVPRLYSEVRPQADYHRSLNLLRTVKLLNHSIITKSGLMLGLGEKDYEVVTVMEELRAAECDCVTLGQYLPPSPKHYHLARYLTPPEFEEYHNLAREMGFSSVRSGPFTRSSYDALEICREVH